MNYFYATGMTYTFFRFLAWSDLLGLLFCISFINHTLKPATPVYSTAYWYAHFETFLTNTPMSVSVFTVVCITIDRYFSVCRPTEFKNIHTRRYARIGMSISVLVAAVMWFPTCFMKVVKVSTDCDSFNFDKYSNDNNTYYVACMKKNYLEYPANLAYSWIRQSVVTFIPIILLLLLNTMIIRNYIDVVRRRRGLQTDQNQSMQRDRRENISQQEKEDKNLIRMLYAIMITFFITMFPPGIANAIYTEFLSTNLQYEIFRAVANDLEILNHAMNFYLYMILSKPLRAAIKEYLLKTKQHLNESISNSFDAIRKDVVKSPQRCSERSSSTSERTGKLSDNNDKANRRRPVSNISIIMDSSEYALSQNVLAEMPRTDTNEGIQYSDKVKNTHEEVVATKTVVNETIKNCDVHVRSCNGNQSLVNTERL